MDSKDISNCIETLQKGGIILYPTDTIWGIGCDATNAEAVAKIFSIKQRDESKSLIVLVKNETMLERYVEEIPDTAEQLLKVADKPMTIIYPQGKNFAPGVCATDGSVGVRVCDNPFCQAVLERFRKPIVSTSANFSGQPSPASFADIDKKLISLVDYTAIYGRDLPATAKASSIIKIDADGSFKIIRP